MDLFSSTKKVNLFSSTKKESSLQENQFGDTFVDPLCNLNLKETSEFVRSFPMTTKNRVSTQRRRSMEAPPTPGRPMFSFSAANPPRRSIPSKWDDAEKWLISRSCHESPAHLIKPSDPSRLNQKHHHSMDKPSHTLEQITVSQTEVFKDKFTDNVEPPLVPDFSYCELIKDHLKEPTEVHRRDVGTEMTPTPTRTRCHTPDNVEPLLFPDFTYCEPIKDHLNDLKEPTVVHRRDVGTEMTPTGTRCHTPIKISSPARHNTPENRSGPLGLCKTTSIDISELQDCHFAKLQLSAQYDSVFPNWSSREEEEQDMSKSLRHSEMVSGERRSFAESRAAAWEDEERTKSCIKYQREEAKIQAWVNLQSAKAEAQSRKLEVKIQKMRANLEEKLSKRLTTVHKRAVEWRTTAQVQHSQQILKASEQKVQKMKSLEQSQLYDHALCGCFPLNNQP